MIRIMLILAVACLPATAGAEDKKAEWGGPTVDYSADMVFTNSQGRSRTARLYYTANRQRLEYKAGKEIVAVIFDQVANKAYQLLLNARGWRPIRAIKPQFNFGMSEPTSTRVKIGDEKMAGMDVTKYRVSSKTSVGDEFEGVGWATGQRIIVKMVGKIRRGKQSQTLTMVLQNLKIGKVDPSLLTVPDTYKKLPPLKK